VKGLSKTRFVGKTKGATKGATKLIAIVLTIVLILSSLYGCNSVFDKLIAELKQNQTITGYTVENPRPLDVIGEELFLVYLSGDFSTYHQLIAHPESYNFPAGFVAPEPTFGDFSDEAALEAYEYFEALLWEVKSHDPSLLSPNDLRLYNYLIFELESTLALKPYYYYGDPYEPSMGIHMEIPLVLLTFEFRTTQDIDDYLKLIADIPRVLDQANDFANKRAADGLFPNRAAIESAIEEAEVYTAPVSNNILVTSFENSLNSGKGPFARLTAAERNNYADKNRELVRTLVIPAYQNAIKMLEDLARKTDYEKSVASYPNAKKYCAAKMRAKGFYQSPEDAIAILDKAIDDLWRQAATNNAAFDWDLQDRVAKKNLPADATAMVEFFNMKCTEHFPDIGQRPFIVKSASDDEVMKSILAFYLYAPVDDLTENRMVYYSQNISNTFSLGTTLGHESFPGHLYQYNYFGLTQSHPIEQLIGTTAYAEGYAIYSGYYTLLYMGFSEEEARAINASNVFFRVLEARIDLGVNYQGWTVKQTSQYLSKWGIGSYGEEIYQGVASNPFVSVPYGLAPLEFMELLSVAEAKLGKTFDIIEFHTVILKDGGLPLELLRKNVYDWLRL